MTGAPRAVRLLFAYAAWRDWSFTQCHHGEAPVRHDQVGPVSGDDGSNPLACLGFRERAQANDRCRAGERAGKGRLKSVLKSSLLASQRPDKPPRITIWGGFDGCSRSE
jgi:hypothetical protein